MVNVAQTITELPIFSALTLAEAEDMARFCRVRRLKDGELLFAEGDPSHDLFIILSGVLRLSCVGPGGVQVVVGKASAGDLLGEMGVLDNAARSATATALGSTELLQLGGTAFSSMVDGGHPAAWWIMRRIRVDLCDRLRQVDRRVDAVFEEAQPEPEPERSPGRLRSFLLSVRGLT